MSADPSRLAGRFGAQAALAAILLPEAVPPGDGAHDVAHLVRVFKAAETIRAAEGGDARILAASVLLHDCVSVEKNSPERPKASRLAAERATAILQRLGWEAPAIAAVAHAIAAHSYSAGIRPETPEAMILQDADRLDAIGMIGIARCFYIAGRLGSALYDAADPEARSRPLDDAAFALDHFPAKLLRLADGFNTATGRAMAQRRHARLESFLAGLAEEI